MSFEVILFYHLLLGFWCSFIGYLMQNLYSFYMLCEIIHWILLALYWIYTLDLFSEVHLIIYSSFKD